MTTNFDTVLTDFWRELGGEGATTLALSGPRHALPSPFDVTGLAVASIGAATQALAELHATRVGVATAGTRVDSLQAAVAFRSERYVRPQGWHLPPVWDPIAGNYRTRDGFIRLHTNYAHHREAALRVLGVPAEREAVGAAVNDWEAEALETAVVDAGGCAAALRTRRKWQAHAQGAAAAREALVQRDTRARACGSPRWARNNRPQLPLSDIRVLDLTRVIAGPVGTRLLAAYGAAVLRIDPPGFEEIGALLAITTVGKRRAFLDLRTDAGRERFRRLLAEADVLVHGYRTDALERLGFDRARLRADYPELIVTQHNAYGFEGPWALRRGFDSLVQMCCGIASRGQEVYGDEGPHPLPAQALDHATGYLIAAATCRALTVRLRSGNVTHSRLSLARTAHALVTLGDLGDPDAPEPGEDAVDAYIHEEQSAFGPLRCVRVPGAIEGVTARFDRPAGPLGSDAARF
jgi:hypothetical protein